MAEGAEVKSGPAGRLSRIKFIHLVRQGLTAKEIAQRMGCDVSSIYERAKSYGLELAKDQRGPRGVLPFGLGENEIEVEFEE